MGESRGVCDQLRIEGKAGLQLKEIRAEGVKLRVKNFQNCGIVDGGVFDGGVIAVNEESSGRQERKIEEILAIQRNPRENA